MIYKIKNFFRRIKNAIDFARIGFNDVDYDYCSLFDLLEFKFKRMDKFVKNNAMGICLKRNETISLCVNLLERINKDEVYDVNYKKHEKKWGKRETYFVPYTEHTSIMKDRREDRMSAEQTKKMHKECLEAIARDEKHKQQDIDLLFDTMKKYCLFWWD